MKNTLIIDEDQDDLHPEYRFDYTKARPNRFAEKAAEGSSIIILDPDIAPFFPTSESVNDVLRALIKTMPTIKRPKTVRKHSKITQA